jgi:hypothetical protein
MAVPGASPLPPLQHLQKLRAAVLRFPIPLDNAIIDIRRTRHIGDFTQWEQHAEYTKAFARLMRDLKAQPVDKADAQPAS